MYANTTYHHMYYEAAYTEYRPVHQTKISTNVHHVPTYCSPNISRIRYTHTYMRMNINTHMNIIQTYIHTFIHMFIYTHILNRL